MFFQRERKLSKKRCNLQKESELEPKIEWNSLTRHGGQVCGMLQWHLYPFLSHPLYLIPRRFLPFTDARLYKKFSTPIDWFFQSHAAWLCCVFSTPSCTLSASFVGPLRHLDILNYIHSNIIFEIDALEFT